MEKKNIILIVVLVIAVVAMGAYVVNQSMNPQKDVVTSSYDPKTQGKVVLGITDAAADLNGVSSVFIIINNIQIHSTASGWATVSNETGQYDLLALKQSGAVSLLANANVNVGTYDQIKLMVEKVTVVKNGVSQEAKLPSGELKMIASIVVSADKTSTMVFDFIADKSLHMTGSGKIIFAPVVKIQKTSSASVELTSKNEIKITGGNKEKDEDVGMDEKGEVKSNFELKGDLDIDVNNKIEIKGDVKIDDELVFNFTAQNNSGVSGMATVEDEDGKIKVALKTKSSILDLLTPAQPAHIHLGSCANIGGIKYPLNSVVDGKSETMINASLAQLKAELPLAINVHKSAEEVNVYIACTDLNF